MKKVIHIKKWLLLLCLPLLCMDMAGDTGKDFFFRGTLYQDWLGMKSEGGDLYQRLSGRLKLTLWNRPGNGWTVSLDMRDRYTFGELGGNQLIIYNARLSYDHLDSKIFFSLGQMNLYDTAGIGELTGGVVGYRLGKHLSLGGYGGLEPDIYNARWDNNYIKYGLFIRYQAAGAKQISLSYNHLAFNSETERHFLYLDLLLPLRRVLVLYGNLEYDLAGSIKSEDRLSQLFLNARLNLSRYADITGHYSSGRGLDYHRFLLEQSQDPAIQVGEIERYYYNEVYGLRLSIKPIKSIRLFVGRKESERKDRGIRNHTTQFGLSLANILKSGISLYGNFHLNRGDASESDSYYISASRNFGKLSLSLNFANFYNAVRLSGEGSPQLLHYPDRRTLSANLFLILSRCLAISLDYAYSYQQEDSDHQLFVRIILRVSR